MIARQPLQAALASVLAEPGWRPFDPHLLTGLTLAAITSDSREVKPGMAFAAFPGDQRDGRGFIADAIGRGASAVLWEAQGFSWPPSFQVANLAVPQLRSAIGPIASEIYGKPSERLWVAGVTGTNGKTSCSTWIAEALDRLGRHAALAGTLGNGFTGRLQATLHTTPDAAGLQGLIADFVGQGADCFVMEVSSHGLDQGRVNGVAFDVALFTNLSRDHLDYHGDMVHYAAAKAKLFAMPGLQHAVVNVDDEFGCLLADALGETALSVVTYGLGKGELTGENTRFNAEGLGMEVSYQGQRFSLTSRLLGMFNAHNLLGVIGVLLASGIALADAVAEASSLLPVAGRLQRIGGGGLPVIAIDYAHTPDALDKVLKTLRPIVPAGGRLICVFGCGGDRDRGKRPLMGAIATELADFVLVTNDNPRDEPPRAIIDDIVAGIRQQNFAVIEDREQAILRAMEMALAGDVVLLAGKGHETYQETRGVRQPFSDLDIASRALDDKATRT